MAADNQPRLFVALTVDVDPDANRAAPGRPDAVGPGGREPSVDACRQGLAALMEVLDEVAVPATLFWEARTLAEMTAADAALMAGIRANTALAHGTHGARHEDFAGRASGMPLGLCDTREVLTCAGRTFEGVFGRPPRAFRAPYCRLTPELAHALEEQRYALDASDTQPSRDGAPPPPYPLPGAPGIWELPLTRGLDQAGRPISGYMWRLLEGAREPGDYVALARSLCGGPPGGLLQLALHPWHLVVGEDGTPHQAAGGGIARVRAVLAGVAGMGGVSFTTLPSYLQRWLAHGPSRAGDRLPARDQ